jgi:probable phosphoglycerate mutase
MQLIALRHGPTQWNQDRLIQGRTDLSLTMLGRAHVVAWSLPGEWRGMLCYASPLRLATETARLIGFTSIIVSPPLIEMDWGRFEGRSLAELRSTEGAAFRANEELGLDFRPSGGESPREVMARLSHWLQHCQRGVSGILLVTHKGVRRALLSMATGWDMRGPPPVKHRDDDAMVMELASDGRIAFERLVNLGSKP